MICDARVVRCNKNYHQDVLVYFNGFKDCKVVKILEDLSENYNLNYDAPVELLLRIGDNLLINKDKLCNDRKFIEDNYLKWVSRL